MADPVYKPLPFDEAIEAFRSKVLLSDDEYRQLEAAVRARAFSVAGIAEADILLDIYNEILRGLEEGISFQKFKRDLLPKVESAWSGAAPYRLDTIFRTNIQSAYQAGHYRQLQETAEKRPYWQYVAVMDGRVRPSHAIMHGKVLPADDPFWQKNFPPNGFNCRCTVISLSERELKREGLTVSKFRQDIADPGFDISPADVWTPDLSKYPDWLRERMAA